MYFTGKDGFKFLYREDIRQAFIIIQNQIKQVIEGEGESYILNVNEETYLGHIESEYRIDIPELHFDQVYADKYEAEVSTELLPLYRYRGHSSESKKIKKQIVQFYIPCSGIIGFLEYHPASSISLGGGGNGYFRVNGNSLVVELINHSDNPEEIKKEFERTIDGNRTNYNTLRKDIKEFNETILRPYIVNIFRQQKDKFLKKNNLMAALGIPLKKKDGVPTTFSIPKPKLREKIIVRPMVHEQGFKPEPTLDNDNYSKILKIINDVGKNFERLPSISQGKDEETLRDHILMVLDPNFEYGNASGETFNKVGKTDIQLRYDSSVVFIAECKFWSGAKGYHATINQLLSYLTWRDSKTAIIIFVRQKEISNVLETVKSETPNHANYLEVVGKSDENWFNYRFHLKGDKNRELKLAVQLFHLPD
jgi:hypothetical protein